MSAMDGACGAESISSVTSIRIWVSKGVSHGFSMPPSDGIAHGRDGASPNLR